MASFCYKLPAKMHLNTPTSTFERTELSHILPLLIARAQPELTRQFQRFGIQADDMETACYQLYDQKGIDALLQVHPLRESFFQMELSQDRFQACITPPAAASKSTNRHKKRKASRKKDYIALSKDHLQLLIASCLILLLILQLIPKK